MVERLVPDEWWELFQRVVQEAPSRPQGGGRRRHGDREVLAAIVFVATSGCTWQQLPSALFGLSSQTTISDLPFNVSVTDISISDLNSWCSGQIHVCDVLCNESTNSNGCEEGPPPVWECSCSSNSSAPGVEYYSTSIQAQLCQQAFGQCQSQNAGDQEAQTTECVDGIQAQCGTLDIADYAGDDTATTTATTATTATSTAVSTATTTDAADQGGLAPSLPIFATGGMLAVVFGVFAQLL